MLPRPAPTLLPKSSPPWKAWDPLKSPFRPPGRSNEKRRASRDVGPQRFGGNIHFPTYGNIHFPTYGNIHFPTFGNIHFPSFGNINFPQMALGCMPDEPDYRDHGMESHLLPKLHRRLKDSHPDHPQAKVFRSLFSKTDKLPPSVRLHDAPGVFQLPSNQAELNSCTAHAACGLMEFLWQANHNIPYEFSRMFVYQQARERDGQSGNVGASIRSAIKVLHKIGVPRGEFWPELPGLLDTTPTKKAFKEAERHQIESYYRLDGRDAQGSHTLTRIKRVLAAGFPVILGTTIFQSTLNDMTPDFVMPFPKKASPILGSHALLVLGYQDEDTKREKGGLIVRNSWGPRFADFGFCYLDYRYVIEQLVVDCWTALAETRKPATERANRTRKKQR